MGEWNWGGRLGWRGPGGGPSVWSWLLPQLQVWGEVLGGGDQNGVKQRPGQEALGGLESETPPSGAWPAVPLGILPSAQLWVGGGGAQRVLWVPCHTSLWTQCPQEPGGELGGRERTAAGPTSPPCSGITGVPALPVPALPSATRLWLCLLTVAPTVTQDPLLIASSSCVACPLPHHSYWNQIPNKLN